MSQNQNHKQLNSKHTENWKSKSKYKNQTTTKKNVKSAKPSQWERR